MLTSRSSRGDSEWAWSAAAPFESLTLSVSDFLLKICHHPSHIFPPNGNISLSARSRDLIHVVGWRPGSSFSVSRWQSQTRVWETALICGPAVSRGQSSASVWHPETSSKTGWSRDVFGKKVGQARGRNWSCSPWIWRSSTPLCFLWIMWHRSEAVISCYLNMTNLEDQWSCNVHLLIYWLFQQSSSP